LPRYFVNGAGAIRLGNRHPVLAPWNVYPARDGWIAICTTTDGHWHKLCGCMHTPEFVKDRRFVTMPDRLTNIADLDQIISDWTRQHTVAEVTDALTSVRVPVSHVAAATAGELKTDVFSHGDWRSHERANPGLPSRSGGRAVNGRPLVGVTVVEMGSLTAAPLAGRILGLLGAEVLKLEPPHGEAVRRTGMPVGGSGYLYYINNLDKFGCTYDTASESDRARWRRRILDADVFVTNLLPSTLGPAGLRADDLQGAGFTSIYCAISGFGLFSERSDERSVDSTIQAATGVMALTGRTDGPPLKIGVSAVDVLSAVVAAARICCALYSAPPNPSMYVVDVSLEEVGYWAVSQGVRPPSGSTQGRRGNGHPTHAIHDVFATEDASVLLDFRDVDQVLQFVRGMSPPQHLPESACDDARDLRPDAWHREVTAICRMYRAAPLIEGCSKLGLPAALVSDLPDIVNHPLTAARQMIVTLEHPEVGPIKLLGSPVRLSRTDVRPRRLAPALAEHDSVYP
jgi:crotonobetainyl-CoA:carnitine CoA-transferase CaiB-like acyl-CoA transferase